MSLKISGVGMLAPRIWQLNLLSFAVAVFAVSLLTACGGGTANSALATPQPIPPPACKPTSATPPPSTGVPLPAGSTSIPIGFFAVNDTTPSDPPTPLNYGTLGHPVPLAWETIEPTCGTYDFSLFDGFATIAPKDSSGTALMVMTLGRTPPWATSQQTTCISSQAGNATGCTAAPDNIEDWTNFITALIEHYNGTTAPHIKYYEIWNEADQPKYWAGTAAQLEQLAAAAYPILKQDPNSFVIGPSVTGNVHASGMSDPTVWLATYLSAGGSSFMDAASFHGFVYSLNQVPYPLPTTDCLATDSDCGGAITAQVSAYRAVLNNAGMTSTPLFNTEGGFEGATIDPDTGAAWLAQYYALQAGMYSSAQIELVSWFTWGAVSGQLEIDTNVLTEVGSAYNQVSNWLVGNTLSSPCSNAGSIWTCTLTGANGYQAEIIWDALQTCVPACTTSPQTVPSTFLNYQDLAGASTPINGLPVQVGLKPILLSN
jgi:polysaccharide biosynthesis protein PslG